MVHVARQKNRNVEQGSYEYRTQSQIQFLLGARLLSSSEPRDIQNDSLDVEQSDWQYCHGRMPDSARPLRPHRHIFFRHVRPHDVSERLGL